MAHALSLFAAPLLTLLALQPFRPRLLTLSVTPCMHWRDTWVRGAARLCDGGSHSRPRAGADAGTNEAIHPRQQVGECKGEPVFLRKHVHQLLSATAWYRKVRATALSRAPQTPSRALGPHNARRRRVWCETASWSGQ